MHSNSYTMAYAAGLALLVGAALSLAVTGLKPMQDRNALRANHRSILETVATVNPETLDQDYQAYVTERVFTPDGEEISDESSLPADAERLPLYVYRRGDDVKYVIPMRGKGLWGPIGAFLALGPDLSSIYGVAFSHEKETPGLGAEINTPAFQDRFKQKKIYGEDGKLQPVRVLRGAGNDTSGLPHAVDGLTGATMTINGVTEMFKDELTRYANVFTRLRQEQGQ